MDWSTGEPRGCSASPSPSAETDCNPLATNPTTLETVLRHALHDLPRFNLYGDASYSEDMGVGKDQGGTREELIGTSHAKFGAQNPEASLPGPFPRGGAAASRADPLPRLAARVVRSTGPTRPAPSTRRPCPAAQPSCSPGAGCKNERALGLCHGFRSRLGRKAPGFARERGNRQRSAYQLKCDNTGPTVAIGGHDREFAGDGSRPPTAAIRLAIRRTEGCGTLDAIAAGCLARRRHPLAPCGEHRSRAGRRPEAPKSRYHTRPR
jgi:hypothetical protein